MGRGRRREEERNKRGIDCGKTVTSAGTYTNKYLHFYRFINEFNVTIFFIARTAKQQVVEKCSSSGVRRAQPRNDILFATIEMKNTRRLKYTLQFSRLLYTRGLYTNLRPSPSISSPLINILSLRNKSTCGFLLGVVITFGDLCYLLQIKKKE